MLPKNEQIFKNVLDRLTKKLNKLVLEGYDYEIHFSKIITEKMIYFYINYDG